MTTSPETVAAPRRRFSLRTMLIGVFVVSLLFAGVAHTYRKLQETKRISLRALSQAPLNQVLVALWNYHDTYGTFPPAYIADSEGKPMHSWRVLILPWLEQQALYDQYRFDEPWNSPHNRSLARYMPQSYRSPTEPKSAYRTNVVVIVGPETAFPGARSTKIADFKDGSANCILIAEIADSNINWMEPRDLDAATMSFQVNDPNKPSISAARWREPYVIFADTIHAYALPHDFKPDDLKAFTTIAGGEPVKRDDLLPYP